MSHRAGLSPKSGDGLSTEIQKLLPTPLSSDGTGGRTTKGRGRRVENGIRKIIGLLPTPAARDFLPPNSREHLEQPNGHHDQLPNAIAMLPAILPTPVAGDGNKHTLTTTYSKGNPTLTNSFGANTGMRLQPAFVEWMMGYPAGWTELEKYPPRPRRKKRAKDTG